MGKGLIVPFGLTDMGGRMFTIVKVRDDITSHKNPGWFKHPAGTVAIAAPSSELEVVSACDSKKLLTDREINVLRKTFNNSVSF